MKDRIVVIGGGAGGLELAVKLARKTRRRDDVEVVLVDKNPTHIWKPLFHEVATGSMNSSYDETSYRMLARKYRFGFMLGEVTSIDLSDSNFNMSAVLDDGGQEVVPERTVGYRH